MARPAKTSSIGHRRLVVVFVAFAVAWCLMAARLVTLQIVEGSAYAALAKSQRSREIEFPARRGAIFDRSGRPLAVSVDLQTVYTDPKLAAQPLRSARKLAGVLEQPRSELLAKLTAEDSRFQYLARQVKPGVAKAISRMELPGVYLEAEPKRHYPAGRLAAHVLGFVDIDGVGLSGIELAYDDVLRGRPGKTFIEQDPEGRTLPETESRSIDPRPGRSLFLTIDKDIQYYTQRTLVEAVNAYGAAAGTAIVMSPSNGEIIAMANVPEFDPNAAGDFPPEAMRNRAVTDFYEPGSAFKVVTTAAALDSGAVTPRTKFKVPDTFPYSDRVFHDSHAHPPERMSVTRIIEESSNVGTIKMGLELGGAALDRYVRSFGFGSTTGLDFPAETAGSVLDREDWSGSTIATVPIGQGIAVSPLQLTTAFATLANGGVWVEPKLLAGTADSGNLVEASPPPATRRVVSKETAAEMKRILTGVTRRGTGIEAAIPGFAVAGKTGTAQKPVNGVYGSQYVATFAGWAPAADPKAVVLVTLDNPSPIWGGLTAAPTFAEITELVLKSMGAPPSRGATGAVSRAGEPSAGDVVIRD